MNGSCTVDDCDHPHKALGLCAMHYMRQRRNGTLELRQPGEPYARTLGRYEDLRWMLQPPGESVEQACKRLNVDPFTLARWLHRHGYDELARPWFALASRQARGARRKHQAAA